MAFLLDTNAWIVYLKTAQSPTRSRLEKLTQADVLLCSVVKAELLHGAQKYGNRELRLGILAEAFAPILRSPSTTPRRRLMPGSGINWSWPAMSGRRCARILPYCG